MERPPLGAEELLAPVVATLEVPFPKGAEEADERTDETETVPAENAVPEELTLLELPSEERDELGVDTIPVENAVPEDVRLLEVPLE